MTVEILADPKVKVALERLVDLAQSDTELKGSGPSRASVAYNARAEPCFALAA